MKIDIHKKLYFEMLRIRLIEEEISKRYSQQKMRCPTHLSVGQEATPVAVANALKDHDYMMSTHRSHAHYLAKGGSVKGLISELYGKATGCAKGQGGSMHLVDLSVNFLGSTSIVGGTTPVGTGVAFACKMRKLPGISVICIGDTVLEEGVFHESMNFASLHKLPALFMCENNFFSCFSHLSDRQPERPLTDVAKAHAMPAEAFDGNDVFDIYERMPRIIEHVRSGAGPYFCEYQTYRQLEHCGPNNDDGVNYRDPTELQHWLSNDPLLKAKKKMVEAQTWDEAWEKDCRKKIAAEINEAFDFAESSPFPPKDDLGRYVYAP